ncbi:MAG: hypothetical protein K2M04_07195 [Muribaculaceae bacterium]|nr:hypothetical protein [Muribaculaceae bacterium]
MAKNYFKRSIMLLAAAAVVASASADGAYRDVTLKYMTNPAFLPGWQGALTAVADGVGEVWCGAFNLYQTVSDAKPGKYTLTAQALYRCGNNDFAKENMKGGEGANYNAFAYINDQYVTVKGLFDGRETAPNGTAEARAAFDNEDYTVTVEYTLAEEGDLVVGITNLGGYYDEWCCFSDFKLVGPDGEIKLENADFSAGIDMDNPAWNMKNSGGSVKKPDVNNWGGVYRKTNASPYNFGQQVDLPAGKYRFSALTFLRHGGAGNYSGTMITCKGQWGFADPTDGNSPKDWFDKDLYDAPNTYLEYVCGEPAENAWDKQALYDLPVSMVKGQTYTVKVKIKGSTDLGENNVDLWPIWAASENKNQWGGSDDVQYLAGKTFTADWAEYTWEFEASFPHDRLQFCFGKHGGSIDFDDLTVIDNASGKVIAGPTDFADGKYTGWSNIDYQNVTMELVDEGEENTIPNAYLYMSYNEEKPANMNYEDEFGDLGENDKRVCLLDCWQICDGDYSIMPENETRGDADKNEIVPAYEQTNVLGTMMPWWDDSGKERESAFVFVNEPMKYRQYVEFELKEPAKVWVGLAKDENNPAQYWNPFSDFKLEAWDDNYNAIDDVFVGEDSDLNAPVEYYNLQGVRVDNPSNGLYIVKQGKKVTKQVIR